MDHLSALSYTRVTNCQKWSHFPWLKLIGILAQYRFFKLMPRIFKYGDIPNVWFTPDKELNILIYRSPSYLIIYRSHTLLKNGPLFWPTLYINSDLSMQTHVQRSVAGCFAVLRQLRSIRRDVPSSVYQSLVVALVLEMCENRFFVTNPSHFNDFIPFSIPFPFPSEA